MRQLALVTGSGRRLGAHIAAALADAGYDIALHAAHDHPADDWLIERLAGVAHRLFVADLADAVAVAALPAAVSAHFGRPIDLLVNSASRFAALDGTGDYADLIDHLRVNLAAPWALAHSVAAAGASSVVNILDQRIANPPIDQLSYTLSKQALGEATRTLAIALGPNVRVNGVAPGLTIPTDEYNTVQLSRLAELMPLGRLPGPNEIADAVVWLARARSVTGQTIFVDGGAHLKSYGRDFIHLGR